MQKESLTALVRHHLEAAQKSSSGRSAHTIYGGHEHVLRQTLIALRAGSELTEHENPGEATVQVLHGRVALVAAENRWNGSPGDLLTVPDSRHALEAVEDSGAADSGHGTSLRSRTWSARRLSRCHHEPGRPARGATVGGRADLAGVMTAPGQQPGGERVRVPHVPGALLVASPGERRELGDEVEQRPCSPGHGETPGAVDGRGSIDDRAARPSVDLVAEQPRPSQGRQPTGPRTST